MKVTVEIAEEELVGLVVDALYSMYSDEVKECEKTLYQALANLVGGTDVEAVEIANCAAKDTITIDEFRQWLPQVLTKAFGKLVRKET